MREKLVLGVLEFAGLMGLGGLIFRDGTAWVMPLEMAIPLTLVGAMALYFSWRRSRSAS